MSLARLYWKSEERFLAGAYGIALVVMTLGNVFILVKLNKLNGAIFNALQDYKSKAFFSAILAWTLWALGYVLIYTYQQYVQQGLGVRWRRWMTQLFLGRWLVGKTFYYWQIAGQPSDNPDQRISEDIGSFIDNTIGLFLLILQQFVTFFSFVFILWKLGGPLNIPHVFGHSVVIPGYMVWGCLLFAGLASWIMARLGYPLIGLLFNQQRYEADFRFGLARLRENGESVALSQGENAERTALTERFSFIFRNIYAMMSRQKKLNAFSISYAQIAVMIPYFLAAPGYFTHKIMLGQLMQIANAFGQVQGAVSFFINAYPPPAPSIAIWRAVTRRLADFNRSMEAAQELALKPAELNQVSNGRNGHLSIKDLSLGLPNGETLRAGIDMTLTEGRSVLISAPSGSGKSTLLRAISGIWPYATGHIDLPADFAPMTLPQKPYLPIGTLRAALAYPDEPAQYTDADLTAALVQCQLIGLADRLEESENWSQVLSPGEQQRLALARVFLQKPRWLFLDEATSALDEPTEAMVYQALQNALPKTTIISIGHRSSLRSFHDITHSQIGTEAADAKLVR